jgi:hypothetical protein
MQPRVGHVPRRWKVWAEAAAAKLTATAADFKLKETMIGFLTRAMSCSGSNTLMKKRPDAYSSRALYKHSTQPGTTGSQLPSRAAGYHASSTRSSVDNDDLVQCPSVGSPTTCRKQARRVIASHKLRAKQCPAWPAATRARVQASCGLRGRRPTGLGE